MPRHYRQSPASRDAAAERRAQAQRDAGIPDRLAPVTLPPIMIDLRGAGGPHWRAEHKPGTCQWRAEHKPGTCQWRAEHKPDDITTDLAAIGAALDAGPTPGEWMHLPGDRFVYDRMEDGCRGIPVVGVDYQPSFFDRNGRTLDYVAACHPARMARILADHARLTTELAAAESRAAVALEIGAQYGAERDRLKAKLAAAQKLAEDRLEQMQEDRKQALRADAAKWQALYRRAINEANGLTNYVEDRPELRGAERRLSAIESEARAAIDAARTAKG